MNRIVRNRRRTPDEIAKYRTVRAQVARELPDLIARHLRRAEAVSTPTQYELLDFGEGRKLERFAGVVLDRPCRQADGVKRDAPHLWSSADAFYQEAASGGVRGEWTFSGPPIDSWQVQFEEIRFALRCTPFGHVGLFPEQVENWRWIANCVEAAARPLEVLNLFAYTGGATLSAAKCGARVVHVDAARNIVAWARRNADHSALDQAPIRWITDDALMFVRREVRRGRRYDAVILDPPTYGHGPRGQPWKIESHLDELVSICRQLLVKPAFALFTCHTPQFDRHAAADLLRRLLPPSAGQVESLDLTLTSSTGRQLPAGVAARWRAEEKS
jgi:23S rRNA (cytosine1962-C5)-methyltransferase